MKTGCRTALVVNRSQPPKRQAACYKDAKVKAQIFRDEQKVEQHSGNKWSNGWEKVSEPFLAVGSCPYLQVLDTRQRTSRIGRNIFKFIQNEQLALQQRESKRSFPNCSWTKSGLCRNASQFCCCVEENSLRMPSHLSFTKHERPNLQHWQTKHAIRWIMLGEPEYVTWIHQPLIGGPGKREA